MTNIETDKKYESCIEKCSYNFKYPKTYLKIMNMDTYLLMKFLDPLDEKLTKVTYNNADYKIRGIFLLWPSMHNFNGKKVDGELIVQHISNTGKILWVCVPIKKSEYSSTQALSNILDESSKLANKSNMEFSYQNDDFSLQDLIPQKPFYSYTLNSVEDVAFIVFDPINAINIDSKKFTDIFQKIIKENKGSFPTTDLIYYNEKGPNLDKLNDGIYISCNPTGESENLVDIKKPKNGISFGDNDNVKMFIKIIIGVVLMVFVFTCISAVFNYFSPKKIINAATNAVNTATNTVTNAVTV